MKYTARDESRVANIARGEVLYLSQDSHQELYAFIQTKWQCFKCFIVFYTNLTHALNKQTGFFVKMCQWNHSSITTLAFYNYPTTVL